MKNSFLIEVKSFKNKFSQACVKYAPGERIHVNATSETSERCINHLEEQIRLLMEPLRNKNKIISSLMYQLSKKSGT